MAHLTLGRGAYQPYLLTADWAVLPDHTDGTAVMGRLFDYARGLVATDPVFAALRLEHKTDRIAALSGMPRGWPRSWTARGGHASLWTRGASGAMVGLWAVMGGPAGTLIVRLPAPQAFDADLWVRLMDVTIDRLAPDQCSIQLWSREGPARAWRDWRRDAAAPPMFPEPVSRDDPWRGGRVAIRDELEPTQP